MTVERLFHENEIKTNHMVSISLLVISGFVAVISTLGILGILNMGAGWSNELLQICCVIVFAHCFIVKLIGYDNEKSKFILMSGLILISGTIYFLYPISTIFLVFGPTMLSIKYYDTKFVRGVTLIAWFVYLITVILNRVLETTSMTVAEFHYVQGIVYWKRWEDVIVYMLIPKTFVFVLEAVISSRIAKAGRNLVITQAEISRKANVMQNDLEIASAIQAKALPANEFVSADKTMYVNAYQSPAKEVGGDFYDYFMLNDHMLVMLVADVSDKGLPSAMFVIEAQSITRFALSEALHKDDDGIIESINLGEAVDSVNRQLTIHNMDGMFVTMWIACLDTRSGVGKYINAGHNLPYVRRADGTLRKLENDPQLFLGCFENEHYQSKPIGLQKGETLVLYTDGVTDARNTSDETFGTDRLESTITNAQIPEDTPASSYVCNAILQSVGEYIEDASQYDDITLLTLSYQGEGAQLTFRKTVEAGDESTSNIIDEINQMLMSVDCPEHERRNIDVVIDEICSNIAMYAYEDGKGEITVEAFAGSNYIAIKFTDSGLQFDPLKEEDPDTDEIRIGGLGIYLVKSLMDQVNYSYDDGKNTLAVYRIWNT